MKIEKSHTHIAVYIMIQLSCCKETA